MEWGGERIYGFDGWVRGRGLAEGGGGEVKRVCCKICMQKGRGRGIGGIGEDRGCYCFFWAGAEGGAEKKIQLISRKHLVIVHYLSRKCI